MPNSSAHGMPLQFTADLDENISRMQQLFQKDNTFVLRIVESRSAPTLRCAVFFLDGMTSSLAINQSIICPLQAWCGTVPLDAEHLARQLISINDSRVEPDLQKMLSSFLYGDTVILTDGDARPVVVNTKGFSLRSSQEPDNERVLHGPREGFTEGFMTNLSMIRRRLRSPHLKCTFFSVGSSTQTAISLCYLEGVCPPAVVAEWTSRLSHFRLDGVLDANYLGESLRDHRTSPFPTMGMTERPDVVAARLLEGQAALVVDGTPVVLTAPQCLRENFQANDDYYRSFFYATLARILRMGGFILSVSIPALYISLMLYHQELIPTKMLFTIAAARHGVPLPTLFETILLLLVFEVLKEAGTRTPGAIGQTMSIVGGLVLGQSAVSARFVSAPIVIVIAISGVLGLLTPKLTSASMICRFFLLLCGAVLGLYGIFFGGAIIFSHICTLQSFRVPYLLPHSLSQHEDAYLRTPWYRMQKQGRFAAQKEEVP